MVKSDDRHAPPEVCSARKAYCAPRLTVYGSVRDLTRGGSIGPPDNGATPSHAFIGPPGHNKS